MSAPKLGHVNFCLDNAVGELSYGSLVGLNVIRTNTEYNLLSCIGKNLGLSALVLSERPYSRRRSLSRQHRARRTLALTGVHLGCTYEGSDEEVGGFSYRYWGAAIC